MPKKRSIDLFFKDILEAAENIKIYTRGMDYWRSCKEYSGACVSDKEVHEKIKASAG